MSSMADQIMTKPLAMVAVVVGATASLAWRYRQLLEEARSGRSARVIWCPPSTPGLATRRRQLAQHVAKILENCSSFSKPEYVPPVLAAGTWTNLALFMLKQAIDGLVRCRYKRQDLTCPDGGIVSIDWTDDLVTSSLPPDAPIVIFLHTITGCAKGTGHFMRGASERGWRSCVFNRRGHGGVPLSTGAFNVMGDVDDTRLQVEAVQDAYPGAFMGMCGISAGSGLLVNYLGTEGDITPVQVACSLCPAYDISVAFTGLFNNYSWVDNYILKAMKQMFIFRNHQVLSHVSPSAVVDCAGAKSIQEFVDLHHVFAGCSSSEEYYSINNPMEHVSTIMRPILLVNADDDVVCLEENIREDVIEATGGAMLLRTKRGSHIAYNDGLFGTGNYLVRVAMDFMETSRLLQVQEKIGEN